MLTILARTTPLVEAVLQTNFISVYVLPDTKVRGAKQVNKKNPLYRSSEIFNSIIKKHSSRTLTTRTCVIYIIVSKQQKKNKKNKKKTKERMKERDTQRKVNLHAFFLNLKLASKIWKVILIVGKWSGLKYNYNEPTYEYIWFSTNEIEKKSKWLPAIPPDPLFICLFPSLPVSFVVFRHRWVCQRASQLQSPCLLQQY